MVRITVKPWQEIVVHEVIEHEVKGLLKLRVLLQSKGMIAEPLLWAEGVLFSRTAFPGTSDVVKEQLQGVIHLTAVEWAPMPKYKEALALEGVTIPVIDASKTEALRDLAKELLKSKKKK